MKTCCSSEALCRQTVTVFTQHPIYSVPLRPCLCLLMQVMKVVFFFLFFFVYLSVMICFVVSVLEGAVCLQIYHCTEPKRPRAWLLNTKVPMIKNNLNIKNRNMFTRGLRVKLKKHSM